jgi:NADH-quinone oxidoreductase subunit M
LIALIAILLAGGLLAWLLERLGSQWPRRVCLSALGLDVLLVLGFVALRWGAIFRAPPAEPWLLAVDWPWVPQVGVRFQLGLDGLSLLLILLTLFLGIMALASAWTQIQERVGFFHFHMMWILSGIIGVFLALDLFLFYFFWEMMLVPMYFIIALWGHANRHYAAVKFFIFTQVSGLFMLVAILSLYFLHHKQTGMYTFSYQLLRDTVLPDGIALWLFLGFAFAFTVKLPVVPVHTWLPDAHTEAPTAGSVILAGLLLKTGAYGLLRFNLALFPQIVRDLSPWGMALGVAGILYGALLALSQSDLKRMVAYTSVSHMGFVLLGIFALNELALQGVVLQIICHGISTGALFFLAGALQERLHTRELGLMGGGLWASMPRMGAVAMFFALASLGLPGLGNFAAEFLVLLGAYRVNPAAAVLASLGLISASVYALWMIQAAFQGPNRKKWQKPDLSVRESAVMAFMIAALVALGVYPQPVMRTAAPALQILQQPIAVAKPLEDGVETVARMLVQTNAPTKRERP